MEAVMGLNTMRFLHNKPEDEVYKLLIDSYWMRVEDEYVFRGDASGLYGSEDPVPEFRRFLIMAETRGQVLPSWWNLEKRNACIAKGRWQNGSWSSLHAAVEKSDITEHYNDPTMPMKLRMLAEEITGDSVWDR